MTHVCKNSHDFPAFTSFYQLLVVMSSSSSLSIEFCHSSIPADWLQFLQWASGHIKTGGTFSFSYIIYYMIQYIGLYFLLLPEPTFYKSVYNIKHFSSKSKIASYTLVHTIYKYKEPHKHIRVWHCWNWALLEFGRVLENGTNASPRQHDSFHLQILHLIARHCMVIFPFNSFQLSVWPRQHFDYNVPWLVCRICTYKRQRIE